MKIISNSHDYYDIGKNFGHDDSVIFQRTSEDLDSNTSDFNVLRSNSVLDSIKVKQSDVSFKTISILFCGKLYGGVNVSIRTFCSLDPQDNCSHTFYDEDSLIDFCVKRKFFEREKAEEKLKLKLSKYDIRWMNIVRKPKRTLREHLAKNGDLTYLDLAIKHRVPIVTCSEELRSASLIKNDLLKSHEFFKVIDPHTAWQEIDMFLSGILAPESKPMITIDDKYKIKEHGFDNWSFRKLPEKKR